MFRSRSWALGSTLAAAGLLVAACGAAQDGSGEEAVEQTTEALSSGEICDLIDAMADIALGDSDSPVSATVKASCSKKSGSQIAYLGGTSPSKFSKSVSKLEAKTLFCALKGADAAKADALSDTGVGRFGVRTEVNVYKSDPEEMTLSGQRIATIYAFGVGLPIDNQSFSWSFPTESQEAQTVSLFPMPGMSSRDSLPEQTGQYAKSKSTGYSWGIDADVNFPLGPVKATLSIDFGNTNTFQTGARRAYYMSGINGSFDSTRRGSWDDYVAACNACNAQVVSPGSIKLPCNCPSTAEKEQALRTCGGGECTEDSFADLSDGRVPHENLRGAAGPFWDYGDSEMSDFWHYGKPGSGARSTAVGSGTAAEEPIYTIASDGKNATTALDVRLGFKYDAGVADIGLTVHMDTDLRSGAALREYREPFTDMDSRDRVTEMGLDAQSAFGVDARLVVNVDVPFVGGVKVIDETFDIIQRTSKQSSTKVPSKVIWDDTEAKVLAYRAKNETASFDACMTSAPLSESAKEAETPEAFINKVREEIPKQLFPCNIKICAADQKGGTPKLRSCTWNKTTQQVDCGAGTTTCGCLDSRADLCDAEGNVYKAKSDDPSACFDVVK